MSFKLSYIRSNGQALPISDELYSAANELNMLFAVTPRAPHLSKESLDRVCKYFFVEQLVRKVSDPPFLGYLVLTTVSGDCFSHHFPDPIITPDDIPADFKFYCDRFPHTSTAREFTILTETDFQRSFRLVFEAVSTLFLWD